LAKALKLNPKLKKQAGGDKDLSSLKENKLFIRLIK
jgi:hypothetical protein